MKIRMTPWFPFETRPVHAGWYDTRIRILGAHSRRMMTIRAYYNGFNWYWQDRCHLSDLCANQNRDWRGMSESAVAISAKKFLKLVREIGVGQQ